MSGSGARDGRPAAVSRRIVGLLATAWSLMAGGWFLSIGGDDVPPSPIALAAGLFIAVVWGLGMLMLMLFLRRADE